MFLELVGKCGKGVDVMLVIQKRNISKVVSSESPPHPSLLSNCNLNLASALTICLRQGPGPWV